MFHSHFTIMLDLNNKSGTSEKLGADIFNAVRSASELDAVCSQTINTITNENKFEIPKYCSNM